MKLKGLFSALSGATEEQKTTKRRSAKAAEEPQAHDSTARQDSVAHPAPNPQIESDSTLSELKAPWLSSVTDSVKASDKNSLASKDGALASDEDLSALNARNTVNATERPSNAAVLVSEGGPTPPTSGERDAEAVGKELEGTITSGSSTCPSSRLDHSPEQTDRSSELNSQRSLIQASNPNLPPHIRLDHFLQREPSAAFTCTDSETGTPVSRGGIWPTDSQISSSTVVVRNNHNAKPSLTFTASIEDYAKKADPSTWEPAKFRKSQLVRIQPGIYPVPYKKLSESHSQYTKLNAYVKGTIHQIHKSTNSRDPREFVTDEGLVMYRVFVLRRVNINVEFIFVMEDQMTAFNECAYCNAFACQQCSGCKKEWYCSEHCATIDWRTHRQDCKHKGKTPPPFGPTPGAGEETPAGDTPAQPVAASKAQPLPPRREFRTDGTVKIINGYKPDPEMFRGTTTVLPLCLRPLTLDEELAPVPHSRMGRLWRSASHRLRRHIHKGQKTKATSVVGEEVSAVEEVQPALAQGLINESKGQEEAQDAEGPIIEMSADATLKGIAISQQEGSLIGEALTDETLLPERKDSSGLFNSNCHNSPNSEKSAESLVEGMAPPFATSQGLKAIMNQDSTASMPDLPRIRVRSQAPLSKAKSSVGNAGANRGKKPPSKLGTATSAGAGNKDVPAPPVKDLLESLPDVFKRLTSGTNFNLDSSERTDRSQKS